MYDSTCALCHQKAGAGLPGQFPRLAGRAAAIALSPGGSRYLIEVVLFGMTGKVSVDGTPIVGVMPSFTTLSDEKIASVLEYVTRLGGKQKRKPPLITPEAVANVRKAHPLTPAEVRAMRNTVTAGD
ncbi:MAG TPA: cytochrome c [Steroidobacteraceae bacterium]|nr:cytochrome c [Steroidobacteraceae bacterium]